MDFPERIYTEDEVNKARELIDQGYKHNLTITGTPEFKHKTEQALDLVKTAGHYDFLRIYIRSIIEIDGLTQLHEADAAIWATKYTVENPVDAASFFVQKASIMKEYIEGKLYYGGAAEKRSNNKRLEFLTILKSKSKEKKVVAECERLLDQWRESSLVY
jgi:hypothetical protein